MRPIYYPNCGKRLEYNEGKKFNNSVVSYWVNNERLGYDVYCKECDWAGLIEPDSDYLGDVIRTIESKISELSGIISIHVGKDLKTDATVFYIIIVSDNFIKIQSAITNTELYFSRLYPEHGIEFRTEHMDAFDLQEHSVFKSVYLKR